MAVMTRCGLMMTLAVAALLIASASATDAAPAKSVMKFVDCSGTATSVTFKSEQHTVGRSWWWCADRSWEGYNGWWVDCWWYDIFAVPATKGDDGKTWTVDTTAVSAKYGGAFNMEKQKEYKWVVDGVGQISGAGNDDDNDNECSDVHGNFKVPDSFETDGEHTDYLQNYGSTGGHTEDGTACEKTCDNFVKTCLCDGGTAVTGDDCTKHLHHQCASCDAGRNLHDGSCVTPITDEQIAFLVGDWVVERKAGAIINQDLLKGRGGRGKQRHDKGGDDGTIYKFRLGDKIDPARKDDLNTMTCFFDDIFRFSGDGTSTGTFENIMCDETWIEPWQGADSSGCGKAVAPHDGATDATYALDKEKGTLTVTGKGAHIGLAAITNAGELAASADAADSIIYFVQEISADKLVLDIFATTGWWRTTLVKAGGWQCQDGDGKKKKTADDKNIETKAACTDAGGSWNAHPSKEKYCEAMDRAVNKGCMEDKTAGACDCSCHTHKESGLLAWQKPSCPIPWGVVQGTATTTDPSCYEDRPEGGFLPGEACCNGGAIEEFHKCCNFPPTGGYQVTHGYCRGGAEWEGGDLWKCVSDAATTTECQAACNADEKCGAYDIESHHGDGADAATMTGECCLFLPGNSGDDPDGDEENARTCYVKRYGESKGACGGATKKKLGDSYTVAKCQEACDADATTDGGKCMAFSVTDDMYASAMNTGECYHYVEEDAGDGTDGHKCFVKLPFAWPLSPFAKDGGAVPCSEFDLREGAECVEGIDESTSTVWTDRDYTFESGPILDGKWTYIKDAMDRGACETTDEMPEHCGGWQGKVPKGAVVGICCASHHDDLEKPFDEFPTVNGVAALDFTDPNSNILYDHKGGIKWFKHPGGNPVIDEKECSWFEARFDDEKSDMEYTICCDPGWATGVFFSYEEQGTCADYDCGDLEALATQPDKCEGGKCTDIECCVVEIDAASAASSLQLGSVAAAAAAVSAAGFV